MKEQAIKMDATHISTAPLVVLIENNPWVVESWSRKAQIFGHEFLFFCKGMAHLNQLLKLQKSVIFFIDVELDEESGVDLVVPLYDAGFRQLYLTTSQHLKEIPEHILQILDKEYPGSLIEQLYRSL